MIERPDVDALLAGDLGFFLNLQVSVREQAKDKTRNRYFISALVLLPVLSFLWFTPLGNFRLWLTIMAGMGAWWWSRIPINEAKKETKTGINKAIASSLGLTYAHDCEEGHGFLRARAHHMVPSFDRSAFEDLWSGEMGGLPFTLHEAHLEERRGSGKHQRWVTVFRGPVITIGCARSFHATTLLTRSGQHKKFGFFGEKDELKVNGRVLAKADMVHPQFEDAFSVFTTDQTEARYLVHPRYIEKLIALEQAFQGQDIRTLFHERELTVLLSTENMFESGSLDHTEDRAMVEMAVSQFMAMAALCGELNEAGR